MKTEKVYSQHEENKEWANNLAFYKDEIRVMEHRLEEIVSKNTSTEVLAKLEHFQNQLIIQKDQISKLSHELNLDNDKISAEVRKNSTALSHRSISDHTAIREEMNAFERLFNELKTDLYAHLSKWM
jgi:hypothetical protein